MTRPWREEIAEVLGSQRINCTGPGEVGCRGVQGWHSWGEHEKHQADAVLAKLAGLLGGDEVREAVARAVESGVTPGGTWASDPAVAALAVLREMVGTVS